MWNPLPSVPLHNAPETASINTTITWTDPDPTASQPVGYQAWWLTVAPPNVSLTPTSGPFSLVVSGPNVIGLAPVAIQYMLPGKVYEVVTQWNLLPAAATQMIKYTPPPNPVVTASFNVRALFVGGSFIDQVYTINATVDYTSGRDSLVAAVNARR